MDNEQTKDILTEIKDGILHLTLNRPESLNAFSPEMYIALRETIEQANTNEDVSAILISGNGKGFCSGGDIKGMGAREPIDAYKHVKNLNELILTMQHSNKIIISAVHGYAAGAGFSLALASDIILAEEDAKFVLSFSKIGLIPDGGSSFLLPKIIGTYRAKELMLNAEPLHVDEAYSLNIVNHIFSKAEFKSKVHEYALNIAKGPVESYRFLKLLVNKSHASTLEEVIENELLAQTLLATTSDHKEGIQAFKEKRTPNFGE